MAELEQVLYAQMLILFAPQAVPAIAHVPLLLTTLASRQPALRKAAADTLRHLAGELSCCKPRDAVGILSPQSGSVLPAARAGCMSLHNARKIHLLVSSHGLCMSALPKLYLTNQPSTFSAQRLQSALAALGSSPYGMANDQLRAPDVS